jgi:hypothetical protein
MTESLDGLPPYSALPPDQDNPNIESATTSNIPISDFRRNEARPVSPENGNYIFNKIFISF